MELIELEVINRSELGSAPARRARKEGLVPAVIYGEGSTATPLLVSEMLYTKRIAGKSHSQLYKFQSTSAALDGTMALVKDVQTEALKGKVVHIDFYAVHEGHKVKVVIPVDVVGEPVSVKRGETLLNQTLYEIEVLCLPNAIPDSVVVDIAALNEGDAIHVSDITLPAGVEMESDLELAVLSIIAKREEVSVSAGATTESATASAPVTETKDSKAKDSKEKSKG